MKKEIERRFLLKNFPIPTSNFTLEVQTINQYYYLIDDVCNRIRKIESSIFGIGYLHTIKTYKDGVTYEDEKFLSFEDYKVILDDIHSGKYTSKYLDKTRYIFPTSIDVDFGDNEIKNIKWEIDVFNFSLIIAEVEIPDMNFDLQIPDFINKQIIFEATGIQELSNQRLAESFIINK
jgi:CYTH domain-containing protein